MAGIRREGELAECGIVTGNLAVGDLKVQDLVGRSASDGDSNARAA
jgi:hypothetical protein